MLHNFQDVELYLNSRQSHWQKDSPKSLWQQLNELLLYYPTRPDFRFKVTSSEIESTSAAHRNAELSWSGLNISINVPPRFLGHHHYLFRVFVLGIATSFVVRFLETEHDSFSVAISDGGSRDTICMCSNLPDAILIPDAAYLSHAGYHHFRKTYNHNWIPWRERLSTVLWRGTANGPLPALRTDDPEDWRWLPRALLCQRAAMLSGKFPIDAKITGIDEYFRRPNSPSVVGIERFVGPRIDWAEYGRYRYTIDIDGWANSWVGLFQKLLCGSTVLKVESPNGFRQWYYDRLKPYVHYIPVKSDLSNLEEAIEFALTNEREAEEVARQGRNLALSLTVPQAFVELAESIRQFQKARPRNALG